MDVLICFTLLMAALFTAILYDYPLPLALLFGYSCFAIATYRRGFSIRAVRSMTIDGIASALIVLKVFLCIGILTATWRIGGTLPLFVYEGIRLIDPQWFILCSFLLCASVSFLIGSSFGTAGTMGTGLIILAKTGGGNIPLCAGAILSGIYFGDRCSPSSSCASLVAHLTGTKLYDNIPRMMKSAAVAVLVTTGIYAVLSPFYPLPTLNEGILPEITALFTLHPAGFLPALIVLLLPLFQVGIKLTMILSSLTAAALALLIEKVSLKTLLSTIVLGYHPEGETLFSSVISGGGLLSMVNVALIVMISSALSGIFKETKMLKSIEPLLESLTRRIGLYPTLLITASGCISIASNQTLAIILVHQLFTPLWETHHTSPEKQALHLSDGVATLSATIPWCIACATPLAMLEAPMTAVPLGFLLYLIPLFGILVHRKQPSVNITTNQKTSVKGAANEENPQTHEPF